MPRVIFFLATFLLGTVLSCLLLSLATGRRLDEWEIGGVSVGVLALLIVWNWQGRRQARRQLRNLRDSALW